MYTELYKLIRPHTTKEEAQFCAATLCVMPREKALALIELIEKERNGCATPEPKPIKPIYSDNGAAAGNRTRLFRDCEGGVEWMYGVDYSNGDNRWYSFGMTPNNSIAKLQSHGMWLSRVSE